MGNLYSHYVFQPPPEPTYEDRSGRILFLSRDPYHPNQYNLCEEPIIYLTTTHGSQIPCVYLENPTSHFTLIFAHGNADDLGLAARQAKEIADALNVSIFVFEYTGYGLSTGCKKASEGSVYGDVDAVWKHLVWARGIDSSRIVVVGRSIGSAAAIYLSAKRRVGGVILIAPVASAVRVALRRAGKFMPRVLDTFRNVERVKFVDCPLLVVHGDEDDIVHRSHGETLAKRARFPVEPLWVKGAQHNNVVEDFRSIVFERCALFLEEVLIHTRRRNGRRRRNTISGVRRDERRDLGNRISLASSLGRLSSIGQYPRSSIQALDPRHGFSGRRPTPLRRSLSANNIRSRVPTPSATSIMSHTPARATRMSQSSFHKASPLNQQQCTSFTRRRSVSFCAASIESVVWADDVRIEEDAGSVKCSSINSSLLITRHMGLGNRMSLRSSVSMPSPPEYWFGRRNDTLEKLKVCFRGY